MNEEVYEQRRHLARAIGNSAMRHALSSPLIHHAAAVLDGREAGPAREPGRRGRTLPRDA